MSDAMLSFKIGPVQPFIEAARTLRDLWSGSYLLSWLTAHAMTALFENGELKPGVTFITPDLDIAPETRQTKNPLLRAALRLPKLGSGDPTLACLPHTFAVAIDEGVDFALEGDVFGGETEVHLGAPRLLGSLAAREGR